MTVQVSSFEYYSTFDREKNCHASFKTSREFMLKVHEKKSICSASNVAAHMLPHGR